MAGETKARLGIGGLLAAIIGIIVGFNLLQPIEQTVDTITGSTTTTTTTTTSSIPVGTPLMPVNVNIFLLLDTLIICVLISIWYFFHYKKRGKW
jgi:hypothetical protein